MKTPDKLFKGKQYREELVTIKKAQIQSNPPTLIRPDQIMSFKEFEHTWKEDRQSLLLRLHEDDIYIPDHPVQRGRKGNKVMDLADSYRTIPDYFPTCLTLFTQAQYGPRIKFPADGRQRLEALREYGHPREFASLVFEKLGPTEAVALFQCMNDQAQMTKWDRIHAYRTFSPAWHKATDDKSWAPFAGATTTPKSPKVAQPTRRLSWKHHLDAWGFANAKPNLVFNTLAVSSSGSPEEIANRLRKRNRSSSAMRNATKLPIIELWTGDVSVRALEETHAVLWVLFLSYFVGLHRNREPQVEGNRKFTDFCARTATLFDPTAKKLPAELAQEREGWKRKLLSQTGADCTPNAYLCSWKGLVILLYLVRANSWNKVLRQIPNLIRNMDEKQLNDTESDFQTATILILGWLNHGAHKDHEITLPTTPFKLEYILHEETANKTAAKGAA